MLPQFVGFNNVDEQNLDGSGLGTGLYFDPRHFVAVEGFQDQHNNNFSVIHLSNGAKIKVLGDAFNTLKQIKTLLERPEEETKINQKVNQKGN